MICTLFTGQTSKEGIFMRYSFEFKMMCVELYKQGKWPETPSGVKPHTFHTKINYWSRLVDEHGPQILMHSGYNKTWSPEDKYELVAQVLAGNSLASVAIVAGISNGQLSNWVRKYRELGYNGLVDKKKGRRGSKPEMSEKSINPKPLNESEREELIRLREENEYMKAEMAVLKKLEALRYEKMAAAQLKAKKQQSSKISESKGID